MAASEGANAPIALMGMPGSNWTGLRAPNTQNGIDNANTSPKNAPTDSPLPCTTLPMPPNDLGVSGADCDA